MKIKDLDKNVIEEIRGEVNTYAELPLDETVREVVKRRLDEIEFSNSEDFLEGIECGLILMYLYTLRKFEEDYPCDKDIVEFFS